MEKRLGGAETTSSATHAPLRADIVGDLPEAHRQAVGDALGAIAKVHGVQGRDPVVVAKMPDRYDYQGLFEPAQGYGLDALYVGEGTDVAGTFVHEVGHALDWGMTPGRGYTSESADRTALHAAMIQFKGAAKRSDAIASVKASSGGVAGLDKYKAYLLSDRETFARAYHQYIVTKAGTPGMRAALAKQQKRDAADNGLVPEQWADDDFAPVGEAVERVLKAKGWMT